MELSVHVFLSSQSSQRRRYFLTSGWDSSILLDCLYFCCCCDAPAIGYSLPDWSSSNEYERTILNMGTRSPFDDEADDDDKINDAGRPPPPVPPAAAGWGIEHIGRRASSMLYRSTYMHTHTQIESDHRLFSTFTAWLPRRRLAHHLQTGQIGGDRDVLFRRLRAIRSSARAALSLQDRVAAHKRRRIGRVAAVCDSGGGQRWCARI